MIGFFLLTIQFAFYNRNKFKGYFKYLISLFILILISYFILNIVGYDILDWYNKRLLAEGSIEQTTQIQGLGKFYLFFSQVLFMGHRSA